jgi:hypothetical protein
MKIDGQDENPPAEAPKDSSKTHTNAGAASTRICACGCGQNFDPTREWQKYINPGHRYRGRRIWCKNPQEIKFKLEIAILNLQEILAGLK